MRFARRSSYMGLLAVTSLLVCLESQAQEPPKQTTLPNMVTHVIELAHLDAYQLAHAIDELGLPVNAVGMSESKLVLRGLEDNVKRVQRDLIDRLDVAGAGSSSKLITEFLPLSGIRSEGLMPALRTVTTGGPTRLAIDEINQMLIVRGPSNAIEEIKKLLTQIEKPATTLTLQFSFIRANIGEKDTWDLTPLTGAMKTIAETLEENGFLSPSLMAPIVVVIDEGQSFDSESTLRTVHEEGMAEDNLLLKVRGEARLQPNSRLVRLNINAYVGGKYTDPEIGGGETHFEAETTIAAKLGSYVILAAAPGSTARGDTIALVVRVTSNNE